MFLEVALIVTFNVALKKPGSVTFLSESCNFVKPCAWTTQHIGNESQSNWKEMTHKKRVRWYLRVHTATLQLGALWSLKTSIITHEASISQKSVKGKHALKHIKSFLIADNYKDLMRGSAVLFQTVCRLNGRSFISVFFHAETTLQKKHT